MTLGLMYQDEGDELPAAIASDRGEKEISRFLHRYGYRCRPARFLTFQQIFDGPEYNELLAQMPDRNPKGINYGRHAFYRVAGDVQLLARKLLEEAHFTRLELQIVLAGYSSFQHLFSWERHVRIYHDGQIEVLEYCFHKELEADCQICQAPAGPAPAPVLEEKVEPAEWRPTRARRPRRNILHASPARWEEWRGVRTENLSPPKGQTGGPS